MIRFVLVCLVYVSAAWGQLRAAQNDPKLEELFASLVASQTLGEAREIEQEIWQIWGEIDDREHADLFAEANRAMANSDLLGAIELLTALIEVAPEFAEAWNKRATVFYLAGKFEESVADIQRTLALEPRHFGALSGFGLILMRMDRPALALRSFEAALAIHPHMPAARAHVELLRERVGGEPL